MVNRTISLRVRKQYITSKSGTLRCSSNTVNYIIATFDIDDEWAECDYIKSVWDNGKTQIVKLLVDNKCEVPHEVLASKAKVFVNLYGMVAGDGEDNVRITTYPFNAIYVNADAKVDGSETVPITPSQFEQFVDAVKSETSKVTGMTATAETLPSGSEATASYSDGVLSLGIPMGAQGEKGETGERGLQGIQGERGERGEQGLQGVQGERGERGETGATGAKGDTGNGISSITKTGSSGLVDTYTITFTDGTSTTFNVTNGKDGSGADIDVDSALSTTSTNPVQNKVITSALNTKANTSSLASVATSGSYNDLSNKPAIPTVPTNVSAFTNDAGYITSVPSEYVTETELTTAIAGKANTADLATVATSGSYADLTNKPTIPTDTTYTLSMSGNVITLTPSSGTATSVTLPVYDGSVI